ncbi:hypothetical protein C3486_00445 [Streptomyces sp. Ru73]|uniref:DUF6479 family protein n=1 Tax=Streptomyces sp. Ru73 TaxID=2080748 RepID=UPI000CDD3D66|nr:DUF6479 family protein [Streptomyces sp. Ru73]POX43434.1 hypothetical protein C3486_00445 [Streptomyces sp. Ru73]
MTSYESLASPNRDLLVGIGPFVAGLIVVLILIGAVVLGLRRKRSRPAENQPAAPENPIGYETGMRADDEVTADGRRRMPYEFDQTRGTRPSDGEPPKWQEGHSGSFGNG